MGDPKYKVWVHIEEYDEERDEYRDVDMPDEAGAFDTLAEAERCRDLLFTTTELPKTVYILHDEHDGLTESMTVFGTYDEAFRALQDMAMISGLVWCPDSEQWFDLTYDEPEPVEDCDGPEYVRDGKTELYIHSADVVTKEQKAVTEKQKFAETCWTVEDVMGNAEALDNGMTEEQARQWLIENEKYLLDAMIERGNDFMFYSLPDESEE